MHETFNGDGDGNKDNDNKNGEIRTIRNEERYANTYIFI